ncbi:UDP-glucose 4-epimerase GalE [Pelagibacteraceae bacterium]|nr:UDP-glucose 4-epimerase GalE [Pelagibacteraceae bacterium]
MVKNILITGGAGYIGSHISEILVKNKKNVFIVDNLSTGYSKLINKNARFFRANINNKNKIKSIIINNKIDSVIHLAASLIIGMGEKYPKFYYKNNVLGTKSLLKACLNTTVKNFIFSSTAAVYKDGLFRVTEKSTLKPKSVYGKTKLKAENLIISHCKKNKINYGILRYFNIVGSSQSGKIGLINKGDHLFKNFAVQTFKKKPIFKIYGANYNTKDKTCIRDFIHVSDIAVIHGKVLEKINKEKKSKILNCGYGRGISVREVAEEFKKYTNKNLKIINLTRRKGDLVKIIAQNKNLIKFINWKPKFDKLKIMVSSSLKWERKCDPKF